MLIINTTNVNISQQLHKSLKVMKTHVHLLLALCIFNSCTLSAGELSNESKQLLDQLQTQIQVTLLSVSRQEQEKGREMSHFHYQVNSPEMQEANIGLSLDIEDINSGFTVVAVKPGSLAQQLDITAGDTILSVNTLEVNAANKDKVVAAFQSLAPGDVLELVVMQQGQKKSINAHIVGRQIPSYQLKIGKDNSAFTEQQIVDKDQCGVVSVGYVPPSTRDIYSAQIINIDGRGVVSDRTNFKLSPGKHILRVHELISGGRLSRHRSTMQIAKTLEVHVQANMRYYLGARFIREKRTSRLKEEYWQPVIWKISEQECK